VSRSPWWTAYVVVGIRSFEEFMMSTRPVTFQRTLAAVILLLPSALPLELAPQGQGPHTDEADSVRVHRSIVLGRTAADAHSFQSSSKYEKRPHK
jgi:hypothetical protein